MRMNKEGNENENGWGPKVMAARLLRFPSTECVQNAIRLSFCILHIFRELVHFSQHPSQQQKPFRGRL